MFNRVDDVGYVGMSPFDIINALKAKKNLDWSEVGADYNPWLVNQAFSFGMQTILLANEINKYKMDPEWQYEFYKHTVQKGAKTTWIKSSKDKPLEVIQAYYNVSINKAKEIALILTDEQIEQITLKMAGGGRE